MKVGTKSVLFGVHQFLWHPITVLFAWIELYGLPNWKELACIFVHDLGYWGKPNMDGEEGEKHPEWGAQWAFDHLDNRCYPYSMVFDPFVYYELCMYHSRTTASKYGVNPSKLCWADKLSIKYDPWWFYILRARLTGEINEYRRDAISKIGTIRESSTDREWFAWARERGMRAAMDQNPASAYELEDKHAV
jgi:hypothetical protein